MQGKVMRASEGKEYYVGDFGDVRLKKVVRRCIGGWLKPRAYVYDDSGKTAQERCVLVVGYEIRR